jgi:hypothetical protein
LTTTGAPTTLRIVGLRYARQERGCPGPPPKMVALRGRGTTREDR